MAVNSLRPSDAIWRQWSWTTLAQVMACCLTAPSHYLNQCWLIIRGVLWHTSESSFAGIAQGIDSGYEFEKDILKNIFKSPRGQWVNSNPRVEVRPWTNNYIPYETTDIIRHPYPKLSMKGISCGYEHPIIIISTINFFNVQVILLVTQTSIYFKINLMA